MRGRAAEIADAGCYNRDILWDALKTEPPADDPSTITQELGLGEEREISPLCLVERLAERLGT
jgi:hypothetical protein